MPTDGILIVGASQAGAQLAASLRELGSTRPITLVGAEDHLPYKRPPLSKTFLSGTEEADALLLRSPAFYADHGIEVVTGEHITGLELDDFGGTARSATGRTFDFGRLALTVGGTPGHLPVPGADLDGIFYLRGLDDATALRARLAEAKHVVVVGGGFIGLEAAAVANALGKKVVVVEALDRLMARAVAPEVSDFFAEAHRRRGVDVRLGTKVVGVSGTDSVGSVELSDGSSLPADLVLVGIGLVANTELAELIGLEVAGGGIVVDRKARTSHPTVVAAGDCTALRTGEALVRIESVANAVDQGRAAAATIAGVDDPVSRVPWFWSHQGDIHLQIAGLSTGHDQVVLRGEPDSEHFSALYYRNCTLIAIDCVNAPRDYMAGRKILETGGSVPLQVAGDPAVDLKKFIRR